MPVISRAKNNIVPILMGVNVRMNGYVNESTTTVWVEKKNGEGKSKSQEGVHRNRPLVPDYWKADQRTYANRMCHELHPTNPAGTETGKSVCGDGKGIRRVSRAIGLYFCPFVCGYQRNWGKGRLDWNPDGHLRRRRCWPDLAMYSPSAESVVFQHFLHRTPSHALFSETIRSDSYISRFERQILLREQHHGHAEKQ